ncbi:MULTISPECIES: TetR/AcrR family transcriptional regulator [unclassified Dysgonomonas]|uniref:TetR/AcrR family transcriptional regulator n=1 Tax=unclassified Dysgonomonas TaxID=2630389 RepID=UPI00067FF4AB|nr:MULTISPECIES: TetR/AcrR family transcriptional regulator [unclassified Dysgonomonas]MBD8348127.1 TetR/AcrR family transcriptional regulator [Dysgonomonas sp. HGC4]MBF0575899.1 TetR/AcrR family transcriptional regulator [Dysgonomonas sp. GY617]
MISDKDPHEVKKRILKEAKTLFIKNGYNGTSIRDIAKVSETNVAMVNYYFQSKYNLFEIIFEEAIDILTQKIFLTLGSDVPFFELIETWINTYYEILFEYPQIPMFILNEVSRNPEKLTTRIKSKNPLQAFETIAKRIEDESAKGTIKETPSADFLLNVLSLSLFPFMFGELAMALMDVSREKYSELIANHKKYVVEFTINALQPNTTS